jgi:uncharacterized protein (TIGR03435 family)
MKIMRLTLTVLLCLAAAWGQAKPPRVEFEVASVKPAAPNPDPRMQAGIHIDGSQVHLARMSMKDLVRIASRLKFYQVTGPEWMPGERYDIDAKLPDPSLRDKVPEMLESLLADRFQLKFHMEKKEMPVYGLVVLPGGSKMKQVPDDPETDGADPAKRAFQVAAQGGPEGVRITYGPGSEFKFGDNKIEGTKLNMTYFVDVLGRFVDRPVVDMTNLPGRYDFTVPLSQEDYNAMLIRSAVAAGVQLPPQALRLIEGADGSLFSALKPLGLKLEGKKAPVEMLVVDSVLKTPTEN